MAQVVVRRAKPGDIAALSVMIDDFAKGHPAASHARDIDNLREAFFGAQPLAHVLVAEKNSALIGFGAGRKTYDLFWSLFGGDGLALYVAPGHRGRGVALCIVAAICAEIREQGGSFLQTTYGTDVAPLYERIAVGRPERACYVSARAFAQLADLAGRPARDIVRELPARALNYTSGPPER